MRLIFFYRLVACCLFPGMVTLTSCQKYLEIAPAPGLVVTSAVFSNEKTALSALSGLYTSQLSNLRLSCAGMSIYGGLYADELTTSISNATTDPFLVNGLTADNATVNSSFYSFSYKLIYQANALISGLDHSTSLTEPFKNQLKGEALFIRSFFYFYLVNLFGDIPLVLSTDYESNRIAGRSATSIVYDQLIADLQSAGDLLSNNYPSAGKGRINKGAANALLARIYLYKQDWSNALATSALVLSSPLYGINPDLNKLFIPGNSEAIWELTNDYGNTSEGSLFIPASATVRPTYLVSNALLSAFEPGDARKSAWISKNTVVGVDYYYPYKYKARTPTPIAEATNLLRLPEQYLIHAEANVHLGHIEDARQDLQMIRNRAKLPLVTAVNPEEMLLAIEQERRIEYFAEWSHRFLDLKRTGKVNTALGIVKSPNWQDTDQLWPIPFAEFKSNPSLTQNDGY